MCQKPLILSYLVGRCLCDLARTPPWSIFVSRCTWLHPSRVIRRRTSTCSEAAAFSIAALEAS